MRRLILVLAAGGLGAFPAAAAAANPGSDGRIAFSTTGPEGSWVLTMDPEGGSQATINQNGYEAAWSPNGTTLSFSSLGQATQGLATMKADGSDISANDAADQSGSNGPYPLDQASWSPDGSELVFSADESEPAPGVPQQLVIVNSDGSGEPFFLTPDMPQGVENPSWSPNGATIAFTAGGDEIDEISPDGTGMTAIGSGSEPDFSPNGNEIVYLSTGGDIWVMNSDGSNAHPLLTGSPCPCRDPKFSPNGEKIVFITGSPPVFAGADQTPAQSANPTNSIEIVSSAGGKAVVDSVCSQYVLSVSWQPLTPGAQPAQPTTSELGQVCTAPRLTPRPTPSISARQRQRRLQDGSVRLRVHGRLKLPVGAEAAQGGQCTGTITMWFLRSHRQIGKAEVHVNRACHFSSTAVFPGGQKPQWIVLRFDGNHSLRPSGPYRVAVR